MNKADEFRFKIRRWISSKVLENTVTTILFTVIVTAIISSGFALDFIKTLLILLIVSATFIIFLIVYDLLSYEKPITKVVLKPENFNKDWKNNEKALRPNIPAIAYVSSKDKALYLQFMDIPFTLNVSLPDRYALEFKAKVIKECFSWCVNASINGMDMQGYMFQYNPFSKKLRPHVLLGYDPLKRETNWVKPESEDNPLESVDNLHLQTKDDWYCIRTEVYQDELTVRTPDFDSEEFKKIVEGYKDEHGGVVTFQQANTTKTVEIKIYDMNDLAKCIYHVIYFEAHLKCFLGGNIGFRNQGLESSFYKDVAIKKI